MLQKQSPPWVQPKAAYIHVPYCAHHCGYCDFAVVTGQDNTVDDYLDALAVELSLLQETQPVRTIFLGGGTPTYLNASQLKRLLQDVTRWLHVLPSCEFSIEANPNSVTEEKISILSEYGVTRISLGAQTFQPRLLRVLERDHQPEDVARAVMLARRGINQVSLDLIFGVSGGSLAEWEDDLRQAIALNPDHISTYGLTYEKGTRLWKQRRSGEVDALGEESELEMYALALDVLAEAGFEQYEISNHARPSCRCRHNEVYWANEAYWGFGLGAARYVNGRRETNTRNLADYIGRALAGGFPVAHAEALESEARARETLAIQIRRSDGVHRHKFRTQTGHDLDVLAGEALRRHANLGLITDDGENVRLTRQGKYVADTLIRDFM